MVVLDYLYLCAVLRTWPDDNDLHFRRLERLDHRRATGPLAAPLMLANTLVLLIGVYALI